MAGIETMDIIASPLAASQIALSEKQKIAGVGLVNIGSETVSLSIFENGSLTSLHTFSFGSSDITNDIALGLKIPLDLAEKLKHGNTDENYSKKKLEEIVEARLSDILELIENYLKKIKRSGLLPAGVIFIGGGASTNGLEELSKNILRLPSNIGTTEIFNNSKTKLRDSTWFTALGLLTLGRETNTYGESSFSNFIKDFKNNIKATIKQLMP
jgi:cell division protein FtsA